MKKIIQTLIIVAFQISTIYASSTNSKMSTWQYDADAFIGWNDLNKKEETIKEVSIHKINWSKREKKLSIVVKTDKKTYRDDFVFCSEESTYYYCGIEDDGGSIKIDNQGNMNSYVSFTISSDKGVVLEFKIKQKNQNKWLSPQIKKTIDKKDLHYFK